MKYIMLQTGEIKRDNDEYFSEEDECWYKTAEGRKGNKVGISDSLKYRRPIMELIINEDGSVC